MPSCRDTLPERVWSEAPSSTRSSLVPLCTCTTSGLGLRRCANAQQSVGESTAQATTTGNMSLTAPSSNKVLSAGSVHGLYNHFNSLLAGTSTMLTCYKHLLHTFFLTLFTVWLQLYISAEIKWKTSSNWHQSSNPQPPGGPCSRWHPQSLLILYRRT